MTQLELKGHIDQIIQNSFNQIQKVYDHQREDVGEFIHKTDNSRIVFPIKRDKETRISEQELRFIFVEEFNQYCRKNNLDLCYSIETPTSDEYRFSAGEGNKQSAMFDLVIYNNLGKRLCAIEFKALNPEQHCYTKDLKKLNNPNEAIELTYFVQVFKKVNRNTILSVKDKLSSLGNVCYRCYALDGDNNLLQELRK